MSSFADEKYQHKRIVELLLKRRTKVAYNFNS